MSQIEYIASLHQQGEMPKGSAIVRDLLDNIDGLPGARLRLSDGEVWVSTHEQVMDWLTEFWSAYVTVEERESSGNEGTGDE